MRIAKLQRDGILQRNDDESFDKFKSCISGKMARKPFPHQGYALEYAARILNMVPTKKVDKTSYDIRNGKALNMSYLNVWGCEAFVKRDTLDKLEPISVKFSLYKKPVRVSRCMKQVGVTQPSKDTSEQHDEVEHNEVEPRSEKVTIRRSERISQAPDRYGFYVDAEEHELGDLNEPPNYKVALSDHESDKWVDSMNAKTQSMKDNQVVNLPPDGEAPYILKIKITRDRSKWLIALSQSAYFDKILKKFKMENSKRGNVLMQEKSDLSKSQGANTPNEDMVLVYGGNPENELKVTCYIDASFLSDKDNTKSQSDFIFVLNGGVVDWKSVK
ncbi:hypothetical protein Tco_1102108 [Tanacetum coccineum]